MAETQPRSESRRLRGVELERREPAGHLVGRCGPCEHEDPDDEPEDSEGEEREAQPAPGT